MQKTILSASAEVTAPVCHLHSGEGRPHTGGGFAVHWLLPDFKFGTTMLAQSTAIVDMEIFTNIVIIVNK